MIIICRWCGIIHVGFCFQLLKLLVLFVIRIFNHLLRCYWIKLPLFRSLNFVCTPLLGTSGMFTTMFRVMNPCKKLKLAISKTYFLYHILDYDIFTSPTPINLYWSPLSNLPIFWWYTITAFGHFTVIDSLPLLLVTLPTHLAILVLTTCKVLLSFNIFITMTRLLLDNLLNVHLSHLSPTVTVQSQILFYYILMFPPPSDYSCCPSVKIVVEHHINCPYIYMSISMRIIFNSTPDYIIGNSFLCGG